MVKLQEALYDRTMQRTMNFQFLKFYETSRYSHLLILKCEWHYFDALKPPLLSESMYISSTDQWIAIFVLR